MTGKRSKARKTEMAEMARVEFLAKFLEIEKELQQMEIYDLRRETTIFETHEVMQ